jgi:L-iditol 2-dehydrogenase
MPAPEASPEDVLVRVRACGIGGSDVHGLDGSTGRRIPPLVMGHEAAGEIAQTGAGVSNLAVGERVTFNSTIYCGQCFCCGRGEVNLCENRQVLGVSPGRTAGMALSPNSWWCRGALCTGFPTTSASNMPP